MVCFINKFLRCQCFLSEHMSMCNLSHRTQIALLSTLILVGSLSARAADVDASPHGLLERGYARYTEGKYPEAITLLRIASFDSLDDIPSFVRANVYVALCASRMNDHLGVTNAVAKVTEAERLAPAFASLSLGADRAAFEALARPLGFTPGVPSARATTPLAAPRPAPPITQPATSSASGGPAVRQPSPVPAPAPPARPVTPTVSSTATPSPGNAVHGETSGVVMVAPGHGNYALQIAIACEQSTVDRFREQFHQLRAEPIKIKGRSCFRVVVGRYPTTEAARAARSSVRSRAGIHEMPNVVRIP